ncbi:CHAT domain-containing protein [Penicillium canescens]|nr:CHAT domain-containing protein [Penicillium canescens]
MEDLEEAINVTRQLIDATPPDHLDRAGRLNNLGVYLGDRYSRIGTIADLEEAINVARQAVDATPPDHPHRGLWLNNLGDHLVQRYSRTRLIADLGEAIKLKQQAIRATPLGHPNRATWLTNLGVSLSDRYFHTRAMEDLDQAINMARQALNATPPDHPERAGWLNNLGIYLGNRYFHTGAMEDLDQAINMARQALNATPPDHPGRVTILSSLGLRLGDKYARTGVTADLDEAIGVTRQAVEATPPYHPDRYRRLSNLGNRLGQRFSRTGLRADLEEAINVTRKAVNATPSDHPERARLLNNFGNSLAHRYARIGVIADLEEAINIERQAVEATPPHHPDRAAWLSNLGSFVGDRYLRTGAIADLEEAINATRQAINATPPDHLDRAGRLSNLGIRLGDRYSRTGAMADLEEAIDMAQQAISATPLDHPNRATMLNNLGVRLSHRYFRTRAIEDLEEAINKARQAVDATPLDDANRTKWLSSLGNSLCHRYFRTGAIADLEEAITVARQALNATPPDHPDRTICLNNLGNSLGDRYARTGAIAELEEAICVTRQAVDTTPADNPNRATSLSSLGLRLRDRYARTGVIADLEETKRCFMVAVHQSTAIVSERVAAGRYFLSSPRILQDRQAPSIAKTTIDLIPLLMTRSLQNTDKRHLLSAAVGLSSDAAAIALHFNQGPVAAIELLETGRGVIASAFFERSEISALQQKHLEIARSFIDLRDQLDTPSSRNFLATAERPTMAAETEGHQRQEAGLQLAGLLETIRSQPGFERFLLSVSEADMLKAALYGPIVILNISSHRCDALIITQSGVRLLELPHLSQEAINDRVGNLQSLETLEWLWDDIVRPVLDGLGSTEPPSGSQWQHIWWVPTGKLTRFPLHAAGHHLRCNGETTLDRVVSSYGSSVKAIIHSRRRGTQTLAARKPHNVVAVAMQHTPKQGPLEFAGDEIDAVLAICRSMGLQHTRPQPYKNEVSSALETCWIFHFAGHGGTHPTEPLHSQLFLEDWDREPFTVASLLETNLASKPPFLAYLSACGTGQMLDETSVDESIHLASAFELAGFRHVIGTLWSVDDRLSVDMARMTYEFLHREGVGDESVSGGLHHATRLLRDQWIDSEKHAGHGKSGLSSSERDASVVVPKRKQLHWVPYVHYGA